MAADPQVRAAAELRLEGALAGARPVARDYLSLLKPRIVLLLVVTEVGAMLTAARGLPAPGVLLGGMLGGALAAGGAGAVNCWFDGDLDAIMPRTRRRPVPAGRVPARAALCFGVTVGIAGVLLMAVSTNLLAAVLSAAGGAFYVLVYTMWLKRSTTQNIVVGGAAGAFPPMVGWAAATGRLAPAAWALFALVFFWTPPHFWALALLLRRQYTAAGVPMLPVVAGDRSTRRAIVAYSLLLLGVSLLPGLWLGPLYLVAAAVLGALLAGLAVRAAVDERGAPAAQLFHFSLVYLALIFLAAPLSVIVHG